MRELRESTLNRGGFEDSRGMDKALGRLAEISRFRSQAHEAANLFRDFHIDEIGGPTEWRLRLELQGAKGVLARWAIMAAHEEFRTVDLARVENNGNWDATAKAETDMGELALELFMAGDIDGLIERDVPEAKLRISVDPTMLGCDGLAVVRRKRLMLATAPVPHQFSDMRPSYRHPGVSVPRGHLSADVSLEVDKVSEFVLDLRRLEVAEPSAADEVYAVLGSPDGSGEVTNKEGSTSPDVFEAAINRRDRMLTPAITTYYADRKYRDVRRVDEDGSELEPEKADA